MSQAAGSADPERIYVTNITSTQERLAEVVLLYLKYINVGKLRTKTGNAVFVATQLLTM